MDQALRDELLGIEDNYKDDTELLIQFLEEHGLELDRRGLAAWLAHLLDSHLAAATIMKRLTACKSRLRYLFRKSPEARDPVASYELEQALREFRAPKKASREVDLEKCLSLKELRSLTSSRRVTQKVRLFIVFLAATGLRVSELIGIRIDHVYPEKDRFDRIRILGKGSKERIVRVPRAIMSAVVHEFGGGTWLFETTAGRQFTRQYISGEIHQAGQIVLGRGISAHTLRHTFATLQIQKHRKVKALSLYLGHSSTAITQDMYVHEELDSKDLDLGIKL